MEDWWKFLYDYFKNIGSPTKLHLMSKLFLSKNYTQKDKAVNLAFSNLYLNENISREGYNSEKNLWFPFTSKNGNYEVYFGIDLNKNPLYKEETEKGITSKRGAEIAKEILGGSYDNAYNSVSRYTTLPDTISANMMGGLTDLGYLSGSVYSGYPKLSLAVAEGNYPGILKESKVWFPKVGKWNSSKRITKKKNEKTYVLDENRTNKRKELYFHY